ncbi:MAG: nucleoside deaminase [Acidimicrobiaceae bacterium]|nr:nucleoside deaminase [Acidimicrobiaceae bacterium]MYE09378.1 nucleoside deaminase [Acidimicrobiaceae bacterium]MYI35385.1 nucleoside deaminase [Acidimicrobiaceae bacterium]
MSELTEREEQLLRRAIDVSRRSRQNGNHPFGAIFVDSSGSVLVEAENSVVTTGDLIGHAETNLAREMGLTLTAEQIAGGTVYASCEPCAMCAGAMYWAGVNRLVYGMNESDLMPFDSGERDENATMTGVGCRAVLASGQRHIDISGPHLVEEAVQVHHGFWGA